MSNAWKPFDPYAALERIKESHQDNPPVEIPPLPPAPRRVPSVIVKDAPWTAEDWQAFFDERAGILEYDGKHSRIEAERLALTECAEQWRAMYPMPSSEPGAGCVHCSKTSGAITLVPHLAAQRGVFWLHSDCWPGFNAARNREAREALARLMPDLPWSGESRR